MTRNHFDRSDARFRVGCAGLPPRMSKERYFRELSFLEADVVHRAPPRRAALRGWREAAPEGARFALLAWQAITHRPEESARVLAYKGRELEPSERAETGGLRDTPTVRRAIDAMAEAVEVLDAEVIVFRTPPTFAPSARNRDAMRRFFTDLAPPDAFAPAIRVWAPQGLWRPEDAIRAAGELGLVLACDPLARDPLEEEGPALVRSLPREAAYFHLRGLGSSEEQLDTGDLEDFAEFLEDFERAWVAFDNIAKFADARRFARAVGAAPGG